MRRDIPVKLVCLVFVSLTWTGLIRAEDSVGAIGVLPEMKAPTLISESERNPFAKRAEKQAVTIYDKESEESQIRRIFGDLRVNGVSAATNGQQRVLLGDMILEKGKKVPQLLASQTETLIVSDITEQQIELSWVDEATSRFDGRKLLIPISLDPSVEFVLKGQAGGDQKRRAIQLFGRDELGRRTTPTPRDTASMLPEKDN